jgi:type IV secretion system protein VirB6
MVGGVIDTVDCHIRILIHDTYRNLVGPNTWFAAAFTAMLTIYIALIGYQLMFGRGGLRLAALPATTLKIGMIFAFLTSWAAYQTLVFDFLFEGPNELMKVLLGSLSSSGAGFDGDVMGSLQRAFDDITGSAGIYGSMASPTANLLQGGPMLASGLLWLSALMMMLITLGLIIAAKLVLAFLLAIGPVFIGMFLFDTTRALFHGWLRATISFALAPLAVSILGAAMLMILAPFLDLLVENARQQAFDMGPIMTICLIITVFAIVMLLALFAVAIIGRSWSGDKSQSSERPTEQTRSLSRTNEASSIGRAEQLMAHAATSGARAGASTFMIEESSRDGSRRSGEINDAMTSSSVQSGARLGQSYQRSQRPHVRRGEET